MASRSHPHPALRQLQPRCTPPLSGTLRTEGAAAAVAAVAMVRVAAVTVVRVAAVAMAAVAVVRVAAVAMVRMAAAKAQHPRGRRSCTCG